MAADDLPINVSDPAEGSQPGGNDPPQTEGERMTIVDLPAGVAAELLREGVSGHQTIMLESKGNIQHGNAMLRAISNKKFDEVGSTEARAVDRVLAGPNGANNVSPS